MKNVQELIIWLKAERDDAIEKMNKNENCKGLALHFDTMAAVFNECLTKAELLLLAQNSNTEPSPQLPQADVMCSASRTLADYFGKCTPNLCAKRTIGGCDLGVCFLDAHLKP